MECNLEGQYWSKVKGFPGLPWMYIWLVLGHPIKTYWNNKKKIPPSSLGREKELIQ